VPGLVQVTLSAGDSKQDRLKVGLTRRELLVVRWLAVEGLVESPGRMQPPGVETKRTKGWGQLLV
jgi:hypothetical protein